ncbi:MAG: protein-methionine-sulfoxide reductase catalytic subunit MsrP, partial [Candidatus Binatia bacterium]
MAVHIRKSWQLSERELTSEKFFRQRRQLVKSAGLVGLGIAGGLTSACGPAGDAIRLGAQEKPAAADRYPARRNSQFILDRPVTDEAYAASYNNFYEFSVFKSRVYKNAARLTTHPWQVEIAGLVTKPRLYDIDELI